jgi:tetratricopeptide (TPR) repeat protein
MDSTYRKFAELQLAHHDLLAQGKDELPEAEELEARMTVLWHGLDDAQRKSLNGMGSDLSWLRSRGAAPPNGRSAVDVTEVELAELESAQQNMSWHAILYHLRVCAAALPQDLLAYSRATCYFKLDLPQMSVPFADLTVELSRSASQVARLAFEALMWFAPGMAFHRANEILSLASVYPPILVAQSVGYVFDFLGGPAASLDTGRLAEFIREARRRLDNSQPSPSDRELFFQLAGAAMHSFGQEEEARQLYEEGLRIAPDNPSILAGLGKALYESDPARAADLFQRAIFHKASFIRPYLHLAHYHLRRREPAKAYDYAKQALDYATNDRARAATLEMMGISASQLNRSREEVLGMFEEAARLAPESTQIAASLKAFRDGRVDRGIKPELEYQEDSAVLSASEPPVTPVAGEPVFAR